MFNKEIFSQYVSDYKKTFTLNRLNDKCNMWEVIKCFQDNWNIDAENFHEMLTCSLKKLTNTNYLIYQFSTSILKKFAQNEPEKVREMFVDLYNEDLNIWNRYENFKNNSAILFEKYRQGNQKNHSDERSISIYLWLKYPEKYYIYKLFTLDNASKNLKSNYEFIQGDYSNNIKNFYKFCDEICDELQRDDELIEILKSSIDENCYCDPKLKTLTTDFIFYIGQY